MDRRQEGRRKHTAEQTQTDGRTDRRTYGGGGGWRDAEGGYVQFGCLRVWGLYMTYLGGEERSSQEHQGREEKREESLVKWHFGNNTRQSHGHASCPSVSVFTCTQRSNYSLTPKCRYYSEPAVCAASYPDF